MAEMAVNRKQRRGKNLEADILRIEMIRRALTYRDLARMVGTIPQRVANVLSGSDRTWPIRRALNRVLRQRIFANPPKQKPGPKKVKQYED
jgi:alkylated DNA nucleotide flippase Atl1